MRALNLYTLTRVRDPGAFSRLAQILSGRTWHKTFSAHETASLCALVDALAAVFSDAGAAGPAASSAPGPDSAGPAASSAPGPEPGRQTGDWVSFFDGFYFSYTIDHISKEFDLLKLSADADCVLNIELKSEEIEEDRIRRQLEQNRYYLSHIARTILSYTYVMETNVLYCLNDHGYLRRCEMGDLACALQRPALQQYVEEEIQRWFRASDYLISPVKNPEKLLTGRYFLTNQQSEFRRQILETLQPAGSAGTAEESGCPSGRQKEVPVISLTGSAGTGKTLLLFDLAVELSRKKRILFLHGGPLREGHRVIDRRLHKVSILSGTEGDGRLPDHVIREYACILVDEANRFTCGSLRNLIEQAVSLGIPCIFSYDPHSILGQVPAMEAAEALIAERETLRLELSGNIRINRPIFSFLRTLFHQKDCGAHAGYDCIDVLYAGNRQEADLLIAHYLAQDYVLIDASAGMGSVGEGDLISQEYDRVLMVLDRRFYYDESLSLCARGKKEDAISPLYEGLSRAREKLCLLIVENSLLFGQVLAIRES